MSSGITITCFNCGTQNASTTEACPNCGSLQKTVSMHFQDTLNMVDQVRVKKKQGTGKRKVKLDWIKGHETSADGTLVYKERTIDYEQNRYFEWIKNIDGTTLRLCDEPLTEHQNRGNAKFKKST